MLLCSFPTLNLPNNKEACLRKCKNCTSHLDRFIILKQEPLEPNLIYVIYLISLICLLNYVLFDFALIYLFPQYFYVLFLILSYLF